MHSATSLQSGVAEQGVSVLDDVGNVIGTRQQFDHALEEALDLDHLVGVCRSAHQLHHQTSSAGRARRRCGCDQLGLEIGDRAQTAFGELDQHIELRP